jgi:beta-fructofuranosidase
MPTYHFRPARNWINDPIGFTKVGDSYHLFFQYNPLGTDPGIKHWGHTVTTDFIDWETLPLALSPTPGGADEAGCWSGSITTQVHPPHLFYTGVRHDQRRGRIESVCLAIGDDDLRTWRKRREVVLEGPPDHLDTIGFRDPFVWRSGDQWGLLVGSGIRGKGGAVLAYRSVDLLSWRYEGVFFSTAGQQDGDLGGLMWECPQLFRLGDRYVLVVSVDASPMGRALYFLGRVDGNRFAAEQKGWLDMGPEFYAPTGLVEDDGRVLAIGWSPEARSNDAQAAAGWAGVMTLPRNLNVTPGGRLSSSPVNLGRLRHNHWHAESIDLPSGVDLTLPHGGARLELMATFRAGDASVVGFRLRKSTDGRELTTLAFDIQAGTVTFDRSGSSLAPDAMPTVHVGRHDLAPNQPIKVHIFIDESLVECFIDGGVPVTGRIYPTRTDSVGVAAFAVGGKAEIESIDVWHLKPRRSSSM